MTIITPKEKKKYPLLYQHHKAWHLPRRPKKDQIPNYKKQRWVFKRTCIYLSLYICIKIRIYACMYDEDVYIFMNVFTNLPDRGSHSWSRELSFSFLWGVVAEASFLGAL